MSEHTAAGSSQPECSWTGIGRDGQQVIRCGRPGELVGTDEFGESAYACEEHMGQVRYKLDLARSEKYGEGPRSPEDLSRRVRVV